MSRIDDIDVPYMIIIDILSNYVFLIKCFSCRLHSSYHTLFFSFGSAMLRYWVIEHSLRKNKPFSIHLYGQPLNPGMTFPLEIMVFEYVFSFNRYVMIQYILFNKYIYIYIPNTMYW